MEENQSTIEVKRSSPTINKELPATPQKTDTNDLIAEQNRSIFEMDRQRDGHLESPPSKKGSPDIYEITLMDGSFIKGSILDIEDGEYQIHSSNIGRLSIPMESIVAIQKEGWNKSPSPQAKIPLSSDNRPNSLPSSGINEGNINLAQIKLIEEALSSNPDTIMNLSQLQYNDNVINILQDPKMMALIQQGDLMTLQEHPKMQMLMNDPDIQQLLGTIRQ